MYNILLALILVASAIIITVLFQHSVHMDQLDLSVQVDEGSETLLSVLNPPEAYPNPVLDEIFRTLNQIRNDAVGQDIDQGFMDSYLWDNPVPGLETTSLEYVLVVPGNERFEGLPEGFRLLRDVDGEPEDVPDRDVYYPVFIESTPQDQGTVIGVDRTIENVFFCVLLQNRPLIQGKLFPIPIFPWQGVRAARFCFPGICMQFTIMAWYLKRWRDAGQLQKVW